MTMDLHCYTDGTDTLVAGSVDDAGGIRAEMAGDECLDFEPFRMIPDEKTVTIFSIDDLCDCPDLEDYQREDWAHRKTCSRLNVSKTAAEWARETGRGLLSSTEY